MSDVLRLFGKRIALLGGVLILCVVIHHLAPEEAKMTEDTETASSPN